jgi:hypothetical protein
VRILWALSLAQTLAIVLLTWSLTTRDREPAPVPARPTAAGTATVGPAVVVRPPRADCPDVDALRAIVAEELQAARDNGPPPAGEAAPSRHERAPDPAQLARVEEELERHLQAGAISEADMLHLQGSIARLDPAARKRMLSKLVKAMSSGRLEGRL